MSHHTSIITCVTSTVCWSSCDEGRGALLIKNRIVHGRSRAMGHFACFLLIDHVFSDQIDLQIDPRHVLMHIYFTVTHTNEFTGTARFDQVCRWQRTMMDAMLLPTANKANKVSHRQLANARIREHVCTDRRDAPVTMHACIVVVRFRHT
jgi:hypothetical protein